MLTPNWSAILNPQKQKRKKNFFLHAIQEENEHN
jgi:hypothetical protein